MSNVSFSLETVAIAAMVLQMLHIFQLEGYRPEQYVSWIKKNLSRIYLQRPFYVAMVVSLIVCFNPLPNINAAVAVFAALFGWVISVKETNGAKVKKKLSFTPRMKRLCAAAALLCIGIAFLAIFVTPYVLIVAALLFPLITLGAGWLMRPIENAVNQKYLNQAKKKLDAQPSLIKIGITGSFGKTSTKFILASMLEQKYSVLATPSSFNTPMGLTKVINNDLKPSHEVFIAEMGARHVGDIRELVDLVHPQYGIITSVGKQHLETFHTLENIVNTKYELIEGLPADGCAFFANDNGLVSAMYDRTEKKRFLSGFDKKCDVYADDLEVGATGSFFTLHAQGTAMKMHTALLGKHNISNILVCAAAALHLGVSLEQIASALKKLKPIDHRLALMPGANGMIIIDDTFNSNPMGTKAALEVLKSFQGRKVVLTPGMVELGEAEQELNREFGRQMAECADAVILVGEKRTEPILAGLREKNFDENKIAVAPTLDEAVKLIGNYAGSGDVVLFENDLPDNY